MSYQNIFKRYEKKYIITKPQKEWLIEQMKEYVYGDEYGKSTICNLYFDTPDKLLIRRSLDKPVYKEKLRLRSYGMTDEESTVFLEIKKKFDSVVYKRRIDMKEKQAMDYLLGKESIEQNSQIANEIDYLFRLYEGLEPSTYISYEREAFYAKEDRNFRISFDQNVLFRDSDLSLCSKVYGTSLLDDEVIMEIKIATVIPVWMSKLLSQAQIMPSSYSKYGEAYLQMNDEKIFGGKQYA